MPELDLAGALGVRVANQAVLEVRIANQTVWGVGEPELVLLGSWPMNDSFDDVSGNDHHATGSPSITFVDGPLIGSRGAKFTDSYQSINYGRTGLEPTTLGFTTMGWARADNAGALFGILSKARLPGSTRAGMHVENAGTGNMWTVARWKDHLSYTENDGPGSHLGEWVHYAFYDGDEGYAYYVNGQLVWGADEDRSSGTAAWEDYPWASGSDGLVSGAADTYVSMVRLYHGKLTQAQVQAEMNRTD